MAAPVPGQEGDVDAVELSEQQRIRRGTERRVDDMLARVGQALHVVKPAPTDDADPHGFHSGSFADVHE